MMNKRLYTIFNNMKQRCYNPNNPDFRRYGGRGIEINDDWLKSFANFEIWALKNGYDDKMTIDRIKTDMGYNPENCQWITKEENSAKKRKIYTKEKIKYLDTEEWRRKRLVIDRRKRPILQKLQKGKMKSFRDTYIRIRIDSDTHKEFKEYCDKNNITMSRFLFIYIESILNKVSSPAKKSPKPKMTPSYKENEVPTPVETAELNRPKLTPEQVEKKRMELSIKCSKK